MRSRAIKLLIVFGFLLRMGISIWNGFWGPSFGADLDAVSFHLSAVAYSKNLVLDEFVIGHIYSYILGIVYFLTTDSLFVGSLLSTIAWLASALVLLKIMKLLSLEKIKQFKAMLIYALLPSSIFLTSITLRESYQLFFVNLAIFSSLKIYFNKSTLYWVVLFFAVLGMGSLHGALFMFGLFIVISTIFLAVSRGRDGFPLARFIFVAPLVALIVFYGLSLFTSIAYNLHDGLGAAIVSYQKGELAEIVRTNYKTSININGISKLLLFVPVSLFQYLFEPMPWRVSAAIDIDSVFENILRAWLIWKAWAGMYNMPTRERRPLLFVFLSYLVVETIWSLGTINWGTAVRHHIPSIGLLVVSAFAYSAKGRCIRTTLLPSVKGIR